MQGDNISQLLENTLNPSLLRQAENTLLNSRQQEGFITNLLIIGDDAKHKITIRQSALIYVKNALIDDYKEIIRVPDNDFQAVKSSVLQALIRNCHQKSITPTLRQIIYVLAQNQFPHNWQDIIPQIANIIQNSGDFNELYGSIQALKAIVSAFVKKIDKKLTLQNVSNRIVLPLLSLASKLFQNYNQTTSFILISIFKIFSTITNFHIPEMLVMNMHSWMIFVKRLLDINIESGSIDQNMYQLKKICMRIMFRFYQKHLNRKFSDQPIGVINDFHQKYTKGIVESLLLQIINEAQMSKNSNNKNYIHLTRLSLACLSYVYEQDRNAAITIDLYRDKIIYLCLERYKINLNKAYSSSQQFSSKLNEERVHFCKFITVLMKNQTKVAEEKLRGNYNYTTINEINYILGNLYTHIEKGDMQMKQLCFYIYADLASALPQTDPDIQTKMLAFILSIVKPLLLSGDTPKIIKLRCCQILTKYSFVEIPENELTDIGGGVYGCLISAQTQTNVGSMDTFLQIYAVHAFNSLLRYDFIINFTSKFLNNILQVYTSLLQIQFSIIKCLEDMLAKFQEYLQPFGNNLIQMLTEMYFKYNELVLKIKSGQIKENNTRPLNLRTENEEDNDEDEEQNNQAGDNNYLNASKACLSAIRQIIQSPQFLFQKDALMHNLLISIFSDKEQLYAEEGFNILNQVIFKQKNLKTEYNLYFSIIIFGILPLNGALIQKLRSQNTNYNVALLSMLQALCSQPDQDFLENTIGCLRNYISKYQQDLRNQYDQSESSFLQLILNAVRYVHQNQSSKATQTQRSIILTLYISLIEWKALNDMEVKEILQTIGNWMNMQKQACSKPQPVNSKSKNSFQQSTSIKQQVAKIVYSPIYVQIILLSCHFYPEATLSIINGNWIITQLLQNWQRFHCDYENSRLLIGIADLLNFQSVTEKLLSEQIMNRLPQIIERQCKIRVGEEENDIKSQDDEAEEEKFFGVDQNTHIMGWKNSILPQIQNKQPEQMEDQDEGQSDDEDQEFNKYYESPLDSIDQIAYMFNILRGNNCQSYMGLMRTQAQQRLSFLIANVPSKFSTNNN